MAARCSYWFSAGPGIDHRHEPLAGTAWYAIGRGAGTVRWCALATEEVPPDTWGNAHELTMAPVAGLEILVSDVLATGGLALPDAWHGILPRRQVAFPDGFATPTWQTIRVDGRTFMVNEVALGGRRCFWTIIDGRWWFGSTPDDVPLDVVSIE